MTTHDNLAVQPVMSGTTEPPAPNNILTLPGDGNTPEPAPTDQNEPTASRSASLPVERFKYLGRNWTIRKRKPGLMDAWYLYFERDKRRYLISLRTGAKAAAIEEAKLQIDLHMKARENELLGIKKVNASVKIGEVTAIVDRLAIRAAPKCRNQYVWALNWVCQRAFHLAPEKIAELSLARLDAAAGRAFFVEILGQAAQITSQSEQNRLKRTAIQLFAFTKALFSPASIESMRTDLHLDVPNMDGWRGALTTGRQLLNPGDATEWTPPDDEVLRRTLVEFARLGRSPEYIIPPVAGRTAKGWVGKPLPEVMRRNIFIAIGLELSCGLRKSEVMKSKWSWWRREGGSPRLSESDVAVKNASNQISVRPLDPFWHILNQVVDRNGWRQGENCLAGGVCDRNYWPFYHVGLWLRSMGWTTQKTNHALRDYSASLITMKYGLERASRWCRHGQLSTTQSHYSRFVTDEGMDHPKRLAWLRWARFFRQSPA